MVIASLTASAEVPDTAQPGIVTERPGSGPFVEVDGAFLVPYDQTIPGTTISFRMIPVPGGRFLLGSPADEADRQDDEGPQIEVVVDPMWVGKDEVNWQQYKQFMGLYPVFKDFEADGVRVVDETNLVDAITAPTELYEPAYTYEYGEDPQQPAVTMTQYAAQQFTKWLSAVTSLQYRLPTEAEWEYAARGGSAAAYSWGPDPDAADDYAWYFGNTSDSLPLIGTKKPNPFGLHDMHGGVAEWTVNQYTPDGYRCFVDRQPINATEAVIWPETATSCVVRGGSWEMDLDQIRSAARLASDDEAWKDSDPNFPRSPWWFTDDPARGVGFRLFRSYKPIDDETMVKFWEANAEDARGDIQSRLDEGRGVLGLVDPSLPDAIQQGEN